MVVGEPAENVGPGAQNLRPEKPAQNAGPGAQDLPTHEPAQHVGPGAQDLPSGEPAQPVGPGAQNLQLEEPAQNVGPGAQNLQRSEPAQNVGPEAQNLLSQQNVTPGLQNLPPQAFGEGHPKDLDERVQIPLKVLSKGKGVGKLCSKQNPEARELSRDEEPPVLPPRPSRQMHAREPAVEKPPVSEKPDDDDDSVWKGPPKKLTQAAIARRMYRIMQPKTNGEYKVSQECLETYKNAETRPKLFAVFEKVGYNADRVLKRQSC